MKKVSTVEIDVWRIEHDGRSYLERDLDIMVDMLRDMDFGSHYIISKQSISQDAYECLPEFTGF